MATFVENSFLRQVITKYMWSLRQVWRYKYVRVNFSYQRPCARYRQCVFKLIKCSWQKMFEHCRPKQYFTWRGISSKSKWELFVKLIFPSWTNFNARRPWFPLALCILVDFPIYIDTISMGLSIVFQKGSQVESSNALCTSDPQWGCFNHSKQWNAELYCISSGSSLFTKVLV